MLYALLYLTCASFLLMKILQKYVFTFAYYSLYPIPSEWTLRFLSCFFPVLCGVSLWPPFRRLSMCLSVSFACSPPAPPFSLLRVALPPGLRPPMVSLGLWEKTVPPAQPDWWPCHSRRCPRVSLRRTWWAGLCPTWPRPCRPPGRPCTVTTSLATRMSWPSGWSPAPMRTPRSSECSKYTWRGGRWQHPARHWRGSLVSPEGKMGIILKLQPGEEPERLGAWGCQEGEGWTCRGKQGPDQQSLGFAGQRDYTWAK